MDRTRITFAVAAVGILTSGIALAANQEQQQDHRPSQQQVKADKDFGALSTDAASAFRDMGLTRMAIFEGRIDQAKTLINKADAEFGRAQNDRSVLIKAEADLKPPAGAATPATQPGMGAAAGDGQQSKPVAWLPVDSRVVINEDYQNNPAKAAAVADAGKSAQTGDRDGAIAKLKLANVDIAYTVAVVPLQQTMSDVGKAAGLINNGKYYEASQVLRQAQSNERFDVADASVMPTKAAAPAQAGAHEARPAGSPSAANTTAPHKP